MPKDFVSLFIEYSKEYESPESFWKWSSYATIAATLRSNIYLEQGSSRLYPNIYVILLADSAASRKDRPLSLAGELLAKTMHTKLFRGIASIQGILEKLSQDIPVKKTGATLRGGCGIIVAKEFTAALIDDPVLIPRLTDMYDSRVNEDYDYDLRGGSITIKNLCLNILGASNEELLRDIYTTKASYGGLLRRTFLITPNEQREANSLMDIDVDKYDKAPLVEAVEKIKSLEGAVEIEQPAKDLYNKWYASVYASYVTVKDRTGFLQSIHTSVLKVAMIIAASRYQTVITEEVMKQSIFEVTALKPNYTAFAAGSGKSSLAEGGALVLHTLWTAKNNVISQEEFLLHHWQMVSAEDLEKIMDTLTKADLVNVQMKDGKVAYFLTAKGQERFTNKGERGE